MWRDETETRRLTPREQRSDGDREERHGEHPGTEVGCRVRRHAVVTEETDAAREREQCGGKHHARYTPDLFRTKAPIATGSAELNRSPCFR